MGEYTLKNCLLACVCMYSCRSRTPWVVFMGHRPMYVDSKNHKHGEEESGKVEKEAGDTRINVFSYRLAD